MKLRLLSFAAAATVILLSPLAGCSDDDPATMNTGGSPAGGSNPGSSGSGGLKSSGGGGSGGSNTAGGSGGLNSAGVSGGGFGGSNNGGVSGGSGGSSTAGISAGGSGGDPIPGPNFATVQYMIREVSCFGPSCHDSPPPENPLNLKLDEQLYTRMLAHMTKNCGPLINTSNPPESALVKLLKGPCGATSRMPLGACVDDGDSKCVPADYIQAITQWIANGAPK